MPLRLLEEPKLRLLEEPKFTLPTFITPKVIPEIRAMRPEERRYQRPLTEQEKAQAVVDLTFRERGEQVPRGLRLLRAIESPEAQAITQTALLPEYTVLQGIRGVIDKTGGYDLIDRIKRGVLESENTKRFYEYIPKTETLPKWAKITADIGEDIVALGVMGLGRAALRKELLTRNINRKIETAAEQFVNENMPKTLPAGWKAEEALKTQLKNDFKNRLLQRVTAPEVEVGVMGTLGEFKGEIKPSLLQSYAKRQSFLKLVGDELRAMGEKGQALIPKFKVGDVVKLKSGSFEQGLQNVIVKAMEGDKAILDVFGKSIPIALSKLKLVSAKEVKPEIPPELQPLASEALKYKTAEEFTKAIYDNQIKSVAKAPTGMTQMANVAPLVQSVGYEGIDDFYTQATKGIKEVKPPKALPKEPYVITAEDLELKPKLTKNLEKIAIKVKGKTFAYKPGEQDIYNHADIIQKHSIPADEPDIEIGFLTKQGKFTTGIIEKKTPIIEKSLIPKDQLTPDIMDALVVSERQLATKRVLENKSLAKTAKELGWNVEDVKKEEMWLAEKLPNLKEELAQAKLKSEQELAEGFEKEWQGELSAKQKELKTYLAGKLKFNLKSQGEYENLRLLNWLFAKEGERGYTPDEIVGELQGMGFQVETDDDVRDLIRDYFKEEIQKKAEILGRKRVKPGLYVAKPKAKIQEELRMQKLNTIANQLSRLSEIAPRLITPKQIAYIHILKQKNLLTDQQYARLKKIFTGKKTLAVTTPTGKLKKAPITKEEAQRLAEGISGIVPRKPIITGQPPVIPRTKALVPSEWQQPFNDLTAFQATPLSGLDPIRAAELVDGKTWGVVRKTIVEPAREAERKWKNELKNTLDTLTKISKGMRSNSKESEITFKYIEKTLTPEEEKFVTSQVKQTAEYLGKIYDNLLVRINEKRALLNKVPIQKRQDYITHTWELSLLDEFYQGLSNVPDDVINVPSFAKSNSPFFKFALARLGGKDFRLDAIATFETYISRAYPIIYNTDVLKSARPLVNRLPSNAYKYFTQYLDETMALRPTQADKLIPKPLLHGISWLRIKMGKGAILGNIASVFNQAFTLPNTISAIGPKWVASAALKMGRDEWRAFTEAHSKVLQGRIYEIDFDPTLLSKVDNALGFLIQLGDKEMVRLAWGAQFEKSLSKGANFEQAVKEADNIAFKTQSSFNVTDLPPAFRSKLASSFLQFQNTVNNGLNYLRFDLGKEGQERGKWGVFKAGLMWLGTLLALNMVYRQFGIPSAVDEWSDVFPLISIAEYGAPVTYSLPTSILGLVLAKTPQDRTKAAKALRRAIFLFLPAGNQVRKTLEGIYSVSKGGKFDKKGKLQFSIRGFAEQVRAITFGPYGTKKGREYIKRGFKKETSSTLRLLR